MAALRRRPTVSAGASARPDVRRDVEDDIEAPRLLCLHGWLDNAASFVPLMAHLPSVDIVALDLPGHGASDWLDAGYAFAETVYRLRRVLQRLGWTRCHVAGHSLGGCIAPQLAIAAPDTVASLLLIEASGPLSEEADALPNRLRRALEERLDLDRFVSRTYPDPEAAVAARLRAVPVREPRAARGRSREPSVSMTRTSTRTASGGTRRIEGLQPRTGGFVVGRKHLAGRRKERAETRRKAGRTVRMDR